MTNRDNLIGLLKRDEFNFYPIEFSLCPSLEKKYKEITKSKIHYDEYFNFPWRSAGRVEYPNQHKIDWKKYYDFDLAKGVTFDNFGIAHEPGDEKAKHMTKMRHPMKTFDNIEQFKDYPYPDISKAKTDHLKKNAQIIKEKGLAVLGGVWATLWEVPWYMRSMEELMFDMMMEDEKAIYHFEKCFEISCFEANSLAKAGCDVILIGDDIGTQKSIMMSEDLYRRWIKPMYKKIIDSVKKINPDVIFAYHSCGYIKPFIQDFIDVGIDVLNPFQPECMDFKEIYNEYGDKISFWGTIGTQSTMPFGTPQDVRKCVFENLEITGDKGGLLCAPTHLLEPEVPWENIIAYVDAVAEFNKVHFNH